MALPDTDEMVAHVDRPRPWQNLSRRHEAWRHLLDVLDRRHQNGYAMPPEVLAAMSAIDGVARGDRDTR